ncbi:hypothetical protein CI238_02350 [Colletotrichum incanum]|uniref:DUF7918 domain-containing protein n=1 Tax=Colletotrichum incanum TaxID=1573173 RepID=A0A167A953_COLIC|nr:hypothetical protein CI238_02350 [Colletotrichum incanum]
MAVIDGLPEIKVSIRLNGSHDDCAEYDDPGPPQSPASRGTATHSISKIIKSQDDANFSIHCEVKDARCWIQDKRGLGTNIYIDGSIVSRLGIMEKELRNGVCCGAVEGIMVESAKSGMAMLKRFRFTAIKQVEEGGVRVAEDLKVVKHIGNIEIIAYRIEIHRRKDWKPITATLKTELAEKDMKCKNLSHSTSLSKGRETRKSYYLTVTYIDGEVQLARFIFRYKSKAALQIDGIIPRDPSPELSTEHQTKNAADLPEAELLRLTQERLHQLANVKRECISGVKREADDEIDLRQRKIYKTDADGTIDLTSEDFEHQIWDIMENLGTHGYRA